MKGWLEMQEIIDKQKVIEQELRRRCDEGNYTLENPMIVVNPFGNTPLSAIMYFTSNVIGMLNVDVEGICGQISVVEGLNQVVVAGLKANKKNRVKYNICTNGQDVQRYEQWIMTEQLPKEYPKITFTVIQKDKISDGLIALTLGRSEGVKTTMTLYTLLDNEGIVRWLYTGTAVHVFRQLSSGNLLVDAPKSSGICGAYTSAGLIEMDLVGRIIKFYPVIYGMHHDAYELPNGNILTITQRENTKQDIIAEIDRKEAKIIKEWDFSKILDPNRQTVIDKISVNHPLDWLHMNAVVYDEVDDALIITARNQSCCVKINKQTSEIIWIIAPKEEWNDRLDKYVLTPENKEDVCWAPHAPVIVNRDEVMLFDNGNFRSYNIELAKHAFENYSRAISYKIDIDKKTYKATWQYGKERGNALYCPYLGSVDNLNNKNSLVCFGGITKDIFGGPIDDMKSDRMKNEITIIEATNNYPSEVVLEIKIKDKNICTNEGYKCYRASKINLYK
ncbi:MAG: aryl-sulfate sulfotransferase [Cellulosilyticaceae bacterium]